MSIEKEIIKQKMPPILVWDKCVRELPNGIGYTDYPVEVPVNYKCPFNCTFTFDRNLEANASTIIFFVHGACFMDAWPKNRREDQNYMMYTVECPNESLKYFDRKKMTDEWFNSSATYRLDSDVFMPYDALTKITKETPKEYIWDQKEVLKKIKNKTKFAFQALTNCHAPSNRDLLTEKLSKLIQLKVVGGCFGKSECNKECYENELDILNGQKLIQKENLDMIIQQHAKSVNMRQNILKKKQKK